MAVDRTIGGCLMLGIIANSWRRTPATPVLSFTEAFDVFNTVGMTVSAWNEVDLSVYGVPANAVCSFIVANDEQNAATIMGIREVGSTLTRSTLLARSEAFGDAFECHTMWVLADAASKIEVYAPAADVDNLYYLIGWWSSAVSFTERWDIYDPMVSVVNTWQELTITNASANELIHFSITNSDTTVERVVGVQEVGSSPASTLLSLAKPVDGENHWGRTLNVDVNKKVEVYGGSTTTLILYDGGGINGMTFTSSNTVFNSEHIASVDDTWVTWTVDPSIPVGSIVEVSCTNNTDVVPRRVGARSVGSIINRRLFIHRSLTTAGKTTAIFYATVDANNQIEVWADTLANVRFRISGWFS